MFPIIENSCKETSQTRELIHWGPHAALIIRGVGGVYYQGERTNCAASAPQRCRIQLQEIAGVHGVQSKWETSTRSELLYKHVGKITLIKQRPLQERSLQVASLQ